MTTQKRLNRADKADTLIIGYSFPGDDDKLLQGIQDFVYGSLLMQLFALSRDRYLAAASLLRVEDQLSGLLRPMKHFDHRTLQDAHDRIAASFRFDFIDSRQLLLGETDITCRKRLEQRWRDYFRGEAEQLTEDDEFTRAICTATAEGNKEAGYAAETWLLQFLKSRYSRFVLPGSR